MMALAVLRTAIAVVATSPVALSAASGILHARTEIVAHASLRRWLADRPRIFRRHGKIVYWRLRFGVQMLGVFGVFGVLGVKMVNLIWMFIAAMLFFRMFVLA